MYRRFLLLGMLLAVQAVFIQARAFASIGQAKNSQYPSIASRTEDFKFILQKNVNSIDVNNPTGEVHIILGDENCVKIWYEFERPFQSLSSTQPPEFTLNSDKAKLRIPHRYGLKAHVVIKVEKNKLRSIELSQTSGLCVIQNQKADIKIRKKAGTTKLAGNEGKVDIRHDAGSTEIFTQIGNLKLDKTAGKTYFSENIGDVDVQQKNGHISFFQCLGSMHNARLDSGNILYHNNPKFRGRAKLDLTNGLISIVLPNWSHVKVEASVNNGTILNRYHKQSTKGKKSDYGKSIEFQMGILGGSIKAAVNCGKIDLQ